MTDEQLKQIIEKIESLDATNIKRIMTQNEIPLRILRYVQQIAEHLKIELRD